jgi:sugar-specific transcriptional regulator TrmB
MNTAIQQTLLKLGFDPSVAEVYLLLIEGGELIVPQILKKTSLSRASIYEALSLLLVQGFLEYRKEGRNAYYKPAHPGKISSLIDEKKREVALLEGEMNETIRSLTGTFNLTINKPGVRLYEGKEGIIEAYEEILKINSPIDSIEDKGEMGEFIPEYFPKFIEKRIEKKIFNRVVAPSTNQINITSEKELRETRSISVNEFPFSMDIKICKNTILFATLKKGQAIAILIEDPIISENFRILFKFFWNHAAKASPNSDSNFTTPASV